MSPQCTFTVNETTINREENMIKSYALELLDMVYPQDRPSKLNHCLTEKQVFNMLQGALETYADDDMVRPVLRKRVLQVVQNRKRPYTASEWKRAYALNMQSRISGGCSIEYCVDCAYASMDAIGYPEWMCTTPAEAVQDEMECWDD